MECLTQCRVCRTASRTRRSGPTPTLTYPDGFAHPRLGLRRGTAAPRARWPAGAAPRPPRPARRRRAARAPRRPRRRRRRGAAGPAAERAPPAAASRAAPPWPCAAARGRRAAAGRGVLPGQHGERLWQPDWAASAGTRSWARWWITEAAAAATATHTCSQWCGPVTGLPPLRTPLGPPALVRARLPGGHGP